MNKCKWYFLLKFQKNICLLSTVKKRWQWVEKKWPGMAHLKKKYFTTSRLPHNQLGTLYGEEEFHSKYWLQFDLR